MSGPDAPAPDAIDLGTLARELPQAWRSRLLGGIGQARLKLLRMDAGAYPEEIHDQAEALLVLEGRMRLRFAGQVRTVGAGELCLVPAGVAHAVAEGSHGILLIVDT